MRVIPLLEIMIHRHYSLDKDYSRYTVVACPCTVEPLLSGHPWRNGNWPLNRGWLPNRGLSEISIRPFKKVTLFLYKIA